jgi:hypothetical protein
MSIDKKTKVIIDLLEDAVLSSRVFNNIKKVSDCCNINLNSWYAIVYIMGIDLDECTEQSDYITDDYQNVFSNYLNTENSNRSTAVLIYNQFDTMIENHIKEYPYLKVL